MTAYVPPLKKISPEEFMEKFGTLVGGLFIFSLMLSTNFLPELLGCRLQLMLKNSIWAKHLVALLTIFFFVNVTTTGLNWNLGIKFGFAVLMHVLFMFSQRSEYASQIGFLIIILIIYVLQLVRGEMTAQADHDPTLSAEKAQEMRNQAKTMSKLQIGLFAASMIMIAIGHVAYIGKKKLQYRTDFKYWKMLVGTIQCTGTNKRRYSLPEALSEGLSTNLKVVDDRESARLREIANLFEGVDANTLDLKVPSGLSWSAPTAKQVAMAGVEAGLTLSELGRDALVSGGSGDVRPLLYPPPYLEDAFVETQFGSGGGESNI